MSIYYYLSFLTKQVGYYSLFYEGKKTQILKRNVIYFISVPSIDASLESNKPTTNQTIPSRCIHKSESLSRISCTNSRLISANSNFKWQLSSKHPLRTLPLLSTSSFCRLSSFFSVAIGTAISRPISFRWMRTHCSPNKSSALSSILYVFHFLWFLVYVCFCLRSVTERLGFLNLGLKLLFTVVVDAFFCFLLIFVVQFWDGHVASGGTDCSYVWMQAGDLFIFAEVERCSEQCDWTGPELWRMGILLWCWCYWFFSAI